MKKLTLTLAIIAMTTMTFAQQVAKAKEQEVSNAEKFSERAGLLVQKEFVDIGTLKNATFKWQNSQI